MVSLGSVLMGRDGISQGDVRASERNRCGLFNVPDNA